MSEKGLQALLFSRCRQDGAQLCPGMQSAACSPRALLRERLSNAPQPPTAHELLHLFFFFLCGLGTWPVLSLSLSLPVAERTNHFDFLPAAIQIYTPHLPLRGTEGAFELAKLAP